MPFERATAAGISLLPSLFVIAAWACVGYVSGLLILPGLGVEAWLALAFGILAFLDRLGAFKD